MNRSNNVNKNLDIDFHDLERSSGISDVFFNQFDKTFFNILKTEEKEKRKFSMLPHENCVDDGSVSYQYNSDLFRSDDFTNIHKEKYHLVFGGCSETEGVGGNLNETWSHKLYLELKEKYEIDGYYSLGKSGNGWHKIALSLMIYVEKYGKPTHFFVMLPNVGRNYYWNKEENRWSYLQKYVNEGWKESPHDETILFDSDEHKKQFMEFLVGWKMLINYCKTNNIKILYSTWDLRENNNIKLWDQVNDKLFIDMSYEKLVKFIESKYPDMNVPKNILTKRDGHSGDIKHEYWKNVFIEEIEKRGLFND